MADANVILEFWFGHGEPVSADHQQRWFATDAGYDRLCVERFAGDHAAAAAGQLDQWKREPRSCLALVILLDQFPRNIFAIPRAPSRPILRRWVWHGAQS